MSAAQAKQEQRWQAALARPACSRCLHCRRHGADGNALDLETLTCGLGNFVTHAMAVCGAFVQRTS